MAASVSNRVLVVDDERHTARLLQFILTREGYQVEVAYDGEMALKLAHSFRPQAILLDLLLPKLSGTQVLSTLRVDPDPELAKIVVIILTARSFDDMPIEAREVGADAHCTKPIAPSMLLKTLEDHNVYPHPPGAPR